MINDFNNISVVGFHFHLGSQIESDLPFLKLCKKANELNGLIERMKARGFFSDYLNNKEDVIQILI